MKRFAFARITLVLILFLLLTACGAREEVTCRSEGQVKIGQSIADTFDVDTDRVMAWFCAGNEFEDILLALQTSQGLDLDPDALLKQKASGATWDEIWQEIGLTSQ